MNFFFKNNFEITFITTLQIIIVCRVALIGHEKVKHIFLTFFLTAILLKTMKMECFQLTICILLY